MTCRKLTKEEYLALPQDAVRYDTELECNCYPCGHPQNYAEQIKWYPYGGTWKTVITIGDITTYPLMLSSEYPPILGITEKPTDCVSGGNPYIRNRIQWGFPTCTNGITTIGLQQRWEGLNFPAGYSLSRICSWSVRITADASLTPTVVSITPASLGNCTPQSAGTTLPPGCCDPTSCNTPTVNFVS